MPEQPFAVLGLFPDPQKLLDAIGAMRVRFGDKLEAYTPYPIHGIERALGLRKSRLGMIALVMGVLGMLAAFGFQAWVFTTDYQIRFGGKPYFSWASFIPVVFEVTVLLAAIAGATFGMLSILNRLPHLSHPILRSDAIKRVTLDRFALAVAVSDDQEAMTARSALEAAGGTEIELVRGSGRVGAGSLFPLKGVAVVLVLCALAAGGVWQLSRLWPELPVVAVLDEQPKLVPQREHAFFADGQSMRSPVPGTVARGYLPPLHQGAEEAGELLGNPLPLSRKVLDRGRRVYEINCLVCHGSLGDGKKLLGEAYGAAPASFHTVALREAPDGALFHVIGAGKNNMAGYAPEIPAPDRWAVVHYLRVLQRSQNAGDEDFEFAVKRMEGTGR